MKFNVGDKAKITSRIYGHGFKIGEEVVITHTPNAEYYQASNGNKSWLLYEEELTAVQEDVVNSPKHYSQYTIQPMEFIGLNHIGFIEGCIIKYVVRYKSKNGVEDLLKAQHYLEKLIERERDNKITLGK